MDKEILARICPDTAFIYHVMTTIMQDTKDDGADPLSWTPDHADEFIEVYSEVERIGIFRLRFWNNSTWQVCANILPAYRKTRTAEATRAFYRFMIENAPNAHKLIAFIPTYFPHVVNYALKSGWKEEGRMKEGFRKDGYLYDVVQVGVTMDDVKELV